MKRIKKEILKLMYMHRENEINEILDFIASSSKPETDISIRIYKFVARDIIREMHDIQKEIDEYDKKC